MQEKKEIYLMDEQFWSYNAANISQILKKSAALIQEVESSKIGLFEFESNIRNLALKSGLNAIKLTSQSQFDEYGIIPVKISFQSTLQHAVKWFDQLTLEMPYAQVRDINIELDESTKQNKFAVSMYYRYNQTAQESPFKFKYPELEKEIEDHPNKDIRKLAKTGFKLLVNCGFRIDRIQQF